MWEQFFLDFFDCSAESIGVVIRAWGCREAWLQGELYRAGWRRGLRVNEYSLGGNKKADLCCLQSPRMVAEVKVLGAEFRLRFWRLEPVAANEPLRPPPATTSVSENSLLTHADGAGELR